MTPEHPWYVHAALGVCAGLTIIVIVLLFNS